MLPAPLFKFKRGDHCCVFYEDETALLDLLVPFFLEGLKKGERCFCAESDSVARRLRSGLRLRGVDVDQEIARGALDVRTLDEFYGAGRASFDPVALVDSLKEFIEVSVARGFTGSRMAGEMEFVVQHGVELDQLLEYERLVNEAYPSRPVLGICSYHTRTFSPEMLERVLDVHRTCIANTYDGSDHSSLAIRKGRYILDIVADRFNPLGQFYYVAQEHGKKDILGWGAERNFDDAMLEGESLLNSLHAAD